MPQNCSADVEAVMKYVDSVIGSNDQSAINELMTYFSLGNSGSIFNFLDFSKRSYCILRYIDTYID